MAVEDYLEPEVAATAVVTAFLFSPRGRNIIRRGLVYGTAGALIAGDAISSLVRGVSEGAQQAGASVSKAAQNVAQQTTGQRERSRTETEAHAGNAPSRTSKQTTDPLRTQTRTEETEG